MDPIPEDGQRRLTEENLKRLQPSLIRPMSPVSISSSAGSAVAAQAAQVTTADRIARLKQWVYNAMQTLLALGSEGQQVVEADELCVAGPGDVCLRGPQIQHEVDDPAYWEAKLRYFEDKCRPLCHERRKRRRLEAEEARTGPAADEAEDAQALRARMEENRVLWRAKQASIASWLELLEQPPERTDFEPPASDSSSLVEITSVQFLQAVRGRQTAAVTAESADMPGTAVTPPDRLAAAAVKEEVRFAEVHLRSPPESQGPLNGLERAVAILGKRPREAADLGDGGVTE